MSAAHAFPRMRWVCLFALAVWFTTYAVVWGWPNFVQYCDLGVILTLAGVGTGSALLLSSQAVGAMVINFVWALDVTWRLLTGHHLIGGTEYMWDARFPLWIRLLSFYHVAVPILAIWAVRRTGYHPRGFLLQSAIAVPVMIVSRLLGPAKNINFSHVDPILHVSFRPAALHLGILLICLITVVYWPTHRILLRLLPRYPRPQP